MISMVIGSRSPSPGRLPTTCSMPWNLGARASWRQCLTLASWNCMSVRAWGDVLEWNRKHGTSLRASLLCWLESGCNTTASATILSIEPQTMHKRLNKIQDLPGGDLRTSGWLFAIHIAAAAAANSASAARPPLRACHSQRRSIFPAAGKPGDARAGQPPMPTARSSCVLLNGLRLERMQDVAAFNEVLLRGVPGMAFGRLRFPEPRGPRIPAGTCGAGPPSAVTRPHRLRDVRVHYATLLHRVARSHGAAPCHSLAPGFRRSNSP